MRNAFQWLKKTRNMFPIYIRSGRSFFFVPLLILLVIGGLIISSYSDKSPEGLQMIQLTTKRFALILLPLVFPWWPLIPLRFIIDHAGHETVLAHGFHAIKRDSVLFFILFSLITSSFFGIMSVLIKLSLSFTLYLCTISLFLFGLLNVLLVLTKSVPITLITIFLLIPLNLVITNNAGEFPFFYNLGQISTSSCLLFTFSGVFLYLFSLLFHRSHYLLNAST